MMKPFKYILNSDYKGTHQLEYDPMGWEEQSIVLARDSLYHGIFPEVAINFKFVKDGREYIRRVYEDLGIEAVIDVTVYEFNNRLNKYELYFDGALDFETYVLEELFVSCKIIKKGVAQKFKSRDEMLVDLQSLTTIGGTTIGSFTNESTFLLLHSKTIYKQFDATIDSEADVAIEDSQEFTVAQGIGDVFQNHTRYIQLGFSNNSVSELLEINEGLGTGFLSSPAYKYKVGEPGGHIISLDLTYNIKIEGLPYPFGTALLKLKHCNDVNGNGGVFDFIQIDLMITIINSDVVTYSEVVQTYQGTRCGLYQMIVNDTVSYSIARDLSIDDEVSVYFKIYSSSLFIKKLGGQTGGAFQWTATINKDSKLTIKANTLSPVPTSRANSLLTHEAFTRVCQSITDNQDSFYSSLYGRTDSQPITYGADGEGSMRAITNGLQIRGFPLLDKPIFASFKNMFDTFNAIDNIGVGIEDDKVVIEKKEYFYTNDIILTCDKVQPTTFKISVARPYYYNEFEIGYQKWESEEVNGLDEFNAKRQWTTPITAIKNKLSLLSPYIGSGYAIEFTRRKNYLKTSTEDWKYDNDNFIIAVRRDGGNWKSATDQAYDLTKFENILDPDTAYNLDISPKRMLKNWGWILRSGLEKFLYKSIKFSFGEANYKLKSQRLDEANQVIENEDVPGLSLDPPLWLPEFYEFEAPVASAELALIRANPYGQIKFSIGNDPYRYGYIINVKVDSKKKTGTFKLLRANR